MYVMSFVLEFPPAHAHNSVAYCGAYCASSVADALARAAAVRGMQQQCCVKARHEEKPINSVERINSSRAQVSTVPGMSLGLEAPCTGVITTCVRGGVRKKEGRGVEVGGEGDRGGRVGAWRREGRGVESGG